MNFTLEDIVRAVEGTAFLTDADSADKSVKVSCAELDSRLVKEGGVFLAQKGEKVDGHSFIGKVWDMGAKLVITEKTPEEVEKEFGISAAGWGSYILVKDSLIALKQLGKAYREKLSIPIVGITGSVGKTSTKEFVAGVLSEKCNVFYTKGNFNNEIGVPLMLLKIREEHEAAVIEMGINHFGEMTRLSEMAQPDIAVITNIGYCHLEFLGDRDGVLKAKTEIFGNMNPNGEVCLFAGDDKLTTIKSVHGKAAYYFGPEAAGTGIKNSVTIVSEESMALKGSAVEFSLNLPAKGFEDTLIKAQVPLPGHHMVINAAAAANVAMLLGLSAEEIKAGIEQMGSIDGRNEIIVLKDMVMINDCYNANPVSMKSSIDLLKLADGATAVILGDMFELGKDEAQLHSEVGEYAVDSGIDYIYCVGGLSKNMYEGAREAFEKGGKTTQIMYFSDREHLIDGIREDFEAGQREMLPIGVNVLVKASHGMHFEEVVKLLKELDK